MALPLLDAMAPSVVRAAAATGGGGAVKPPVRMACLFFPNGVWRDAWIPKTAGKDYELSPSLKPLAEHKDDLIVISNLDKAHSHHGDGHYAKTANFLTGLDVAKTTGKDISVGGPSMDQLAAAQLGRLTPLPSLELGIDPVASGVDGNVGYTQLYASYISWRSATQPVAKEINPRQAYERLFGAKDASGKPVSGAGGRQDRQALLDAALDDAKAVRQKVGRDDQLKLDEYLDSVRAVEKRLAYFDAPASDRWKPPTSPGEVATPPQHVEDYAERVKLMLDLMVLSFWTDSTRIGTFMFANCVSGRNFSFVEGVRGGHHDTSHHSNKPDKIEQYQRINRWHTSQLAYVLAKMKSIKEGETNLLHNSMILFGSSMSDGNIHEPSNLPIILAGKAGGALDSGRHIAAFKNTPLCNLYVSMLDRMGVKVDRFGDSTGPLANL